MADEDLFHPKIESLGDVRDLCRRVSDESLYDDVAQIFHQVPSQTQLGRLRLLLEQAGVAPQLIGHLLQMDQQNYDRIREIRTLRNVLKSFAAAMLYLAEQKSTPPPASSN